MILHPSLVWCIQVCVSDMVSICPCVGDFWLCLVSSRWWCLTSVNTIAIGLHSGLFCSAQKIVVAAIARCRVTLCACASTMVSLNARHGLEAFVWYTMEELRASRRTQHWKHTYAFYIFVCFVLSVIRSKTFCILSKCSPSEHQPPWQDLHVLKSFFTSCPKGVFKSYSLTALDMAFPTWTTRWQMLRVRILRSLLHCFPFPPHTLFTLGLDCFWPCMEG